MVQVRYHGRAAADFVQNSRHNSTVRHTRVTLVMHGNGVVAPDLVHAIVEEDQLQTIVILKPADVTVV